MRARTKQLFKVEDVVCPLCKLHEETCLHLFKDCIIARAAWFSTNSGIRLDLLNVGSGLDLVKLMVNPSSTWFNDGVSKDHFTLMATLIMDFIWKLRNKVVFHNEKVNFQVIPFKMAEHFKEHSTILLNQERSNKDISVQRWIKPLVGCYKFNCDAALGEKNACVAMLLRDWECNALLGWTRLIPHVSPIAAEARAILWAVQLANELNLQSIIVENDSKTCIDALTGSSTTFQWKTKHLLEDTLCCAKDLASCSFGWVKREANGASHSLCKWGLSAYFSGCLVPWSFLDKVWLQPRLQPLLQTHHSCNDMCPCT
jgi:hypothetical protein